MTEQQYNNALLFIEVGARSMANQEQDLSKSGQIGLAGADAKQALTELYESKEPEPTIEAV